MNITKAISIARSYRRYIVLAVIDTVFFGTISPNASAMVIIPAFILVVVTIYAVLGLLVAYVGKMYTVKPKNQRRIVVVTTVTLSIIIALQSIGQLTIRDVATIVPLILVLYLYISYTKSRRA